MAHELTLEFEAAVREQRLPNPPQLVRYLTDTQGGADYWALPIRNKIKVDPERDQGLCWRINPDYQRGPVWTREQQESFLGFWQCGGFVPPIVLWDKDMDGYEILDGQQRVTAIVEWVEGRVDAWIPALDSYLPFAAFGKAKLVAGAPIRTGIFRGDRRHAMRLYASINSTGVPHTREEIERALAFGEQED